MSYVIYVLLFGLILWGMKFSEKNSFHNDFMSLEVTKCLQGICALCIMFHHISQTPAFRQTGELSIFPDAGFLFVGIFFFCSGFGLVKSARTRTGYLDTFLKKRLPAVLVPFYIMTLAYAVYYVAVGKQMPAAQWALSGLGLVLMNPHAWYVIVITLLYLGFYFAFTRSGSEKQAYVIMGLFVFVQLVFGVLWGHLAWWAGEPYWWQNANGFASAGWWMKPCALWFQGEWWINSTALFFVGMLVARNEQTVVAWIKKKYWLKLILAIVAFCAFNILSSQAMLRFSYWSEFGSIRNLGIGRKIICLLSQILYGLSFSATVFLIMMKARSVNPVTKFLGAMTLEVYLMHNLCLMQFGSIIGNVPGDPGRQMPIIAEHETNLMLFAALVVCGGITLGATFKYLNGLILKFLAGKSSS